MLHTRTRIVIQATKPVNIYLSRSTRRKHHKTANTNSYRVGSVRKRESTERQQVFRKRRRSEFGRQIFGFCRIVGGDHQRRPIGHTRKDYDHHRPRKKRTVFACSVECAAATRNCNSARVLPVEWHENLALFLAALGFAAQALNLSGVSLQSKLRLCCENQLFEVCFDTVSRAVADAAQSTDGTLSSLSFAREGGRSEHHVASIVGSRSAPPIHVVPICSS